MLPRSLSDMQYLYLITCALRKKQHQLRITDYVKSKQNKFQHQIQITQIFTVLQHPHIAAV